MLLAVNVLIGVSNRFYNEVDIHSTTLRAAVVGGPLSSGYGSKLFSTF